MVTMETLFLKKNKQTKMEQDRIASYKTKY